MPRCIRCACVHPDVRPRATGRARRYVILHELMHHQLDELGCPSLCCTLQVPPAPVCFCIAVSFSASPCRLATAVGDRASSPLSLQAKEPPDSWLAKTKFPMFVRGLLVQLWELIQV